jgi:hypothetical protein
MAQPPMTNHHTPNNQRPSRLPEIIEFLELTFHASFAHNNQRKQKLACTLSNSLD